MKKKTPAELYEVNRRIRKDWGSIKPYTRVIEDKRHKKDKYKKELRDYDE